MPCRPLALQFTSKFFIPVWIAARLRAPSAARRRPVSAAELRIDASVALAFGMRPAPLTAPGAASAGERSKNGRMMRLTQDAG